MGVDTTAGTRVVSEGYTSRIQNSSRSKQWRQVVKCSLDTYGLSAHGS